MTPVQKLATERRAHPRHRVLKGAKAVFNQNQSVIDCTVRDLSLGGAKLACADAASLPDIFQLIITSDRELRDVRVAWRKSRELGVAFLTPPRKALHLLI